MALSQNLIPPVAHLKITNLKFNILYTDIPLKVIILSVILELPLSVRGVGRRTQPISKLLNDLLITNALNPTCLV